MHIDGSKYEAECTASSYNNEGKRGPARPSLAGGQYGGGPIGCISVIRDWATTNVDRDISIMAE